MIDALRAGKIANFHSLKRPLSSAAVEDLIRRIRASHPSASQNLFHHCRVRSDAATWSAVAFLYDRPPSFLLEEAGVSERICGFMLLVEHRDHVAIFKSKLDLPAAFATRYLGRVAAERVEVAIARADAVFEKIRLRNMSVSKYVMRSRTFEAEDLLNAVGPAGASRYVPQSYTVRSGTGQYATTPSTGRISQRSDRVGHLALVDYAKSVIDELAGSKGMTLEQLMAFTVTTDHARQEQVWEALQQSYSKESYLIRRQLTESAVRASDRRARFVGLDAYESAGGVVLRDLFEDDGGGWLQDVALLHRLDRKAGGGSREDCRRRLEMDRGGDRFPLRACPSPAAARRRANRAHGDEQATYDALTAEQAKLESEYQDADELPDDVDARLGEIETTLAAFENRQVRYDPAEIPCAGAFISIEADGRLAVIKATSGRRTSRCQTPAKTPWKTGPAILTGRHFQLAPPNAPSSPSVERSRMMAMMTPSSRFRNDS